MDVRILSVHPHPDDESIACGGVLARYADEGAGVHVVTCTQGEEGENLAGIDLGDDDLVTHRRRELAEALDRLGVDRHTYLGYRDSGMAGEPTNEHPESFHMADLREAALKLAAIVRSDRPHVVISDDEHGTYGHPDHVKSNRVTVRAVELARDPDAPLEGEPWSVVKRYVHTMSRERMLAAQRRLRDEGLPSPFGDEDIEEPEDLPFGVPDAEITTRVDVSGHLRTKQAAIAAHRSQISADSFFLNLPSDLAAEALGVEEFVLEEGELGAQGGHREDDLLAGLR